MAEVRMSRLEEETARTAILRNRVSGLEEDLEGIEGERDKLVAGLEAMLRGLRSEEREHLRSSNPADHDGAYILEDVADRLQALLNESKGGDDGDED